MLVHACQGDRAAGRISSELCRGRAGGPVRSVLVVDAGHPRNAPAAHAHGYLTRDGASPMDLLAAGRAEVAGYGGQTITGTVTSLARLPSGASGSR